MKNRVSDVDTSTVSGSSKNSKLNAEQYKLWQDANEMGCKLSLDDYEKQLELLGELKDER